jgi:vacuolar-type H+-ATPase subunit F/Vma7
MPTPIFLGDEITAAGYRLAGVHTRVPAAGEESAALADARASAQLVIVGAGLAARIEAGAMERALTAATPLVVVVPDAPAETAPPDLAARLAAQLGLEA